MEWKKYITVDPTVSHGQAVIAGTRIPVSVILDNLAEGLNAEEIIGSYPALNRESILAAITFAAELARERTLAVTG